MLFPFHEAMAYFLVHALAFSSNLALSVLYTLATSVAKGSSGLASHSNEMIESSTFEIDNAGDHYLSKISRQIEPFEFILG